MPDTSPHVLWFRRDLRLGDHPALHTAAGSGPVLPLFIVDPALWGPAGPARRAHLARSLGVLDHGLRERGGRLTVRYGDPVREVARLVAETNAAAVHVSADHGPYGRRRDAAVEGALDVPLVRTGSAYAVAPGRIVKADGTPYQVFTPFRRAWAAHGWRRPLPEPPKVAWAAADSEALPEAPAGPPAGEKTALDAWDTFRDEALSSYADRRDRPDLAGTSRLSVHLKFGEIHPRTLLAGLGPDDEVFRSELAWREFYGDVLWHHPESARDYLRPQLAGMQYDQADDLFKAWCAGRTGFPFVDAGMRQLLAEGWMHNRVRMVVASFLVKDLHVEWTHGAAHFMRHLADGDLASNSHGWQWTAGCGTDAAPFFRVFNPVDQGKRFDPEGVYVRKYVPELREAALPHEPWKLPQQPAGYPQRIVDHAEERRISLARYQAVRDR
jgi:deoxyribodipyrimidine photo-lyase